MKQLSLSPFLSDGMIIQRDCAFPVYSGEKLTVSFLGKTYESRNVGEKWLITLEPIEAGGPFTMDIVSDNGKVSIKDIYSGDVWLCAGQSNMEMMMQRLRDDFSEEWEIKDFPLIRQFKVPQEWDFSSPREDISGGSWLCASKETLHEFSGTAWFFAKKMYAKLDKKVPIGLVNTAWGGTPIEAWMSAEALTEYQEKIALGRQYADTAKREEITRNTGSAIKEWETNLAHEDLGIPKDWKNPKTDISAWGEISLPGDFTAAGLNQFNGVIWLAKDFEVSASFASHNARIWLGTIVDSDTVYINGTEVGNTAYRYPPRKYIANSLLKEGKNRIVIRVICNNGCGEVTTGKPFRIFTDNETVELEGKWKYKIGASSPVRQEEFFFQRLPMGDYNAMIAPILKYPLKGVIWYQGESNDSDPHGYEKLFRLMIQDWRKKNNSEELPFFFVQLPIWKTPTDNNENSSWAILREAQKAALSLPSTGMAAALELGEWNDLHPINKKDVGERLFLAAEKMLFKTENSSPGPILCRFERQGDKLYLYFDNCADGLHAKEKPYVSVIGDETARICAEIEGKDSVSLNLSNLKNAKKVLYAWADNPRDRQLFNSDGLPMLPFKIEI